MWWLCTSVGGGYMDLSAFDPIQCDSKSSLYCDGRVASASVACSAYLASFVTARLLRVVLRLIVAVCVWVVLLAARPSFAAASLCARTRRSCLSVALWICRASSPCGFFVRGGFVVILLAVASLCAAASYCAFSLRVASRVDSLQLERAT